MSQDRMPFLVMYKVGEKEETQYSAEYIQCNKADLINAMGMLIDICKQSEPEIDQIHLSDFIDRVMAAPAHGKVYPIKKT